MIKDLINAIAEGDTLEIDRTFNSVIAHKISERLDSMRVDVAQSMFNGQVVEEVDLGQADSSMRRTDKQHSYKVVDDKGNTVSKHNDQGSAIRAALKHDSHRVIKEGVRYATGEWHVTDEVKGGIHSTHATRRKAQNMMDKLNTADYDQNKDDPSRISHNLFHHRYGIKVADKPQQNEEIEEGYSRYSPRSYHTTKNIQPFYNHSIDKDGNHVFRNSGDETIINPHDTDALTNYAKRISMDMNTQGGHLGSSSIGMTYGSGDQQKDVDTILAKLKK